MDKQTQMIIGVVVLGVIAFMYFKQTKKEGFQYAPVNPQEFTRPQMAQPDFKAPIAPRFDAATKDNQSLLGTPGAMPMMAAPAQPVSFQEKFQQPDFTQLGGAAAPIPSGALTSKQVDDILTNKFGNESPKYQETVDLMPVPDMRYSAGVDPTDPQSYMYDRTIFSRLKRRYGNQVDFFRGDLDIKPQSRGWFDLQPPTDVDVVQGYFDRYIDLQQETALKDATFERATPVETLFKASVNPMANTQRLAYNNI